MMHCLSVQHSARILAQEDLILPRTAAALLPARTNGLWGGVGTWTRCHLNDFRELFYYILVLFKIHCNSTLMRWLCLTQICTLSR